MLIGTLININTVTGQETAATPEPTIPQPLFAEDTCAPPCWFGLIPGESSEEEVLAFLDAYASVLSIMSVRDVINYETEEPVGTSYYFWWHNYSYFNPPRVKLTIQNGLLYHIWANPNREITFGEMLDILGYPDHLHLGTVGWSTLTAIYEEPRLRILLDSRSPSDLCKIRDIASEFRVMEMQYFSREAAEELVSSPAPPGNIEPRTRLLFRHGYDYTVSQEQLEQWLSGQGDATCSEIWHQLRAESEILTESLDP
jgi:hypothetical protein